MPRPRQPSSSDRPRAGAGQWEQSVDAGGSPDPATLFEPYVWSWFRERFGDPTPPQTASWPRIASGSHTLIFSPTGSGKTLASFLWCLNELYRLGREGQLDDSVYVLYISPLKALNNDIQRNLVEPLEGIAAAATAAGLDLPEVRSEVRTGDTSAARRAAMAGRPPHILITTPESLFIILSTQRFRFALQTVQFAIVDEIHSVCDNKRGVHLSLSLERLRDLTDDGFVRIGLSATQKPLDQIAAFLTGVEEDGTARPCEVVDIGARRDLDVQVVTPVDNLLEAHFDAIYASTYDRLLRLVRDHDTTLIFTNSRYKTERTAVRLNELAEDEDLHVGAHHGSMSRQVRLDMEDRLKRGILDGLVATSSLELGIDVGSIDLVCQFESPGSVSRGLQRIGRAGHLLGATSKGRLLVIDRDNLVEAAVVVRAILDGDIDATRIPTGCLDVLAQHVVGAVAADEWPLEELYRLCRGSFCYADLGMEDFRRVLEMLSGGYRFDTDRAPYPRIGWDRVNDRLTPERGARVIAFRSSGTIPDEADYDVYLVEKKTRVGTLDEDFVEDLRHGDVFVLGSSSWRVTGFQRNRVMVEDVYGRAPTIPFWHGNARSRTTDLGNMVGHFRREMAEHLASGDAEAWLDREYSLDENGIAALCEYFRQQVLVAGVVPSDRLLVIECFRDELGHEQVVVHSSLGGRLNRTWAAALCHVLDERYGGRFSRAVVDDGILLTIPDEANLAGSPLTGAQLAGQMATAIPVDGLKDLLTEAVLQSPAFGSRFRHNAVRSLQVLREYQGRRTPVWIQSARSSELLEACRDRLDYPVMAETLRECRDDDLDVPGLHKVLQDIESGDVEVQILESRVPSPFSHTLLLLGQYYEQGANPTRERRSRLKHLHKEILAQVLDEESLAELLDDEAARFVETKLQFTHPHRRARRADELARALQELGDLVAAEGEDLSVVDRIDPGAGDLLAELAAQRRAVEVPLPSLESHSRRWIAVDLFGLYRTAFRRDVDLDAEDGRILKAMEGAEPMALEQIHERVPLAPRARDAAPDGDGRPARGPKRQRALRALERRLDLLVDAYRLLRLPGMDGSLRSDRSGGEPQGPRYVAVATWIPPRLLGGPTDRLEARIELIQRHLRRAGPVTKYEIMDRYGFSERFAEEVLAELVSGGTVVRGEYVATKALPQFCYRANLEEIHRRSLERLRRELEPASADEYADFLVRWQHAHPDTRLSGGEGLSAVIEQLQGQENYQLMYERHVFPARVEDYRPSDLDRLCYGGEVAWRRFDHRHLKRGFIGFCQRRDEAWLVGDAADSPADAHDWDEDIPEACAVTRAYLAERATCFFDDLVRDTGLEEGLALRAIWHLVWTGEATSDSYESIRHAEIGSGLSGCYDLATRPGRKGVTLERIVEHMRSRRLDPRLGRWVATERLQPGLRRGVAPEERARQWAQLLLARWGFACRDVARAESCAPTWREIVRALKRLELLGQVQRGYYIDGLSGEQYATPEAVEGLRAAKLRHLVSAPGEGDDGDGEGDDKGESPAAGPLLRLNLCDPANPFGTLFPLTTELGGDIKKALRYFRTPFKHLILRDGQPVVLYDRSGALTVLAGLDRHEAGEALGLLVGTADPAAAQAARRELRIADWNGHPIDVSPARHLLLALGFRPDSRSRGGLIWDGESVVPDSSAPVSGEPASASVPPERYECLGREEAPVTYDADWVVSRSAEPVRGLVRDLIERLAQVLPGTCDFEYGPRGFSIRYRGVRCINPHIQQKKVNLHIAHRGWVRPIEVAPGQDLGAAEFGDEVLTQFERSRQAIDTQLDRRPGR